MSSVPTRHHINGSPEEIAAFHRDDSLRLEMVTVCVGQDDILEVTLTQNHSLFDSVIVVTSHDDRRTHDLCRRFHGVQLVITDLFQKNGRGFNKGAAINAGFNYFQYHGWRCFMDADIIPDASIRRYLFNHTALDRACVYGADRVNVVGEDEINALLNPIHPRHKQIRGHQHRPTYSRYMDPIEDYCPIGFFQLWHCSHHKRYPYSRGTAAHDDTMFSAQWPRHNRRLLPTAVCHHLCVTDPQLGENWDGVRRTRRLDLTKIKS